MNMCAIPSWSNALHFVQQSERRQETPWSKAWGWICHSVSLAWVNKAVVTNSLILGHTQETWLGLEHYSIYLNNTDFKCLQTCWLNCSCCHMQLAIAVTHTNIHTPLCFTNPFFRQKLKRCQVLGYQDSDKHHLIGNGESSSHYR